MQIRLKRTYITGKEEKLYEEDVVRVRPKEFEKSWKKAVVHGQVDIRSDNIRAKEEENITETDDT